MTAFSWSFWRGAVYTDLQRSHSDSSGSPTPVAPVLAQVGDDTPYSFTRLSLPSVLPYLTDSRGMVDFFSLFSFPLLLRMKWRLPSSLHVECAFMFLILTFLISNKIEDLSYFTWPLVFPLLFLCVSIFLFKNCLVRIIYKFCY